MSTINYDEYARKHPYFDTTLECPEHLSRALLGGSGTYLEIGAGDGNRLSAFWDSGFLRSFSRIVATDISPVRVERLAQRIPNAATLVADAQSLPCPDGSIDFLFSDQVIEHVPDDRAMVREIHRVLKPGGRACIGSVLKSPGAWYFYRCNGAWVLDPTHLREYASLEEYRLLFEAQGFIVESVSLRPMRFPLKHLLLRLLLLLVGGGSSDNRGRSRLFQWIERWPAISVRIPRYHTIYVQFAKGTTDRR